MKTFWKIALVMLMAMCVTCGLTGFSMYWWPDMPTSPRPSEGRVYPLNNHGRFTYMNEFEHQLWTMICWICPACVGGVAVIHYLIDPFGDDAARRKYRSPPPGFH